MTPILILDGQTNQALAAVRSLAQAGYRPMIASTRRRPLAAWSRHAGEAFLLAGENVAAYRDLRQWAIERRVAAVLPMTERSCVLCNSEREAWEDAGIRIGCAPAAILSAAFDKARTVAEAMACGVTVPRTWILDDESTSDACLAELSFPAVVKSRFSNAWHEERFLPDLGCAYVKDREQARTAIALRRQGPYWPIVQEIVPGTGQGIFVLCDRGRIVAWFAHERLRDVRPSGSGSSLRRSIALAPALKGPAERLLTALAWHGPAMIEYRVDNGVPVLIEVNGRFWSSLQLAIDAGVDFPRLWLELLLHGRSPAQPPAYANGVVLRWFWGDVKRLGNILRGRPAGYQGPYPTPMQGLRELFGRQLANTRAEVWRRGDRWPAIGEIVQGLRLDLPRPLRRVKAV